MQHHFLKFNYFLTIFDYFYNKKGGKGFQKLEQQITTAFCNVQLNYHQTNCVGIKKSA